MEQHRSRRIDRAVARAAATRVPDRDRRSLVVPLGCGAIEIILLVT